MLWPSWPGSFGSGLLLARSAGATERLAAALSNLAVMDIDEGRTAEALARLREALALDSERGDTWGVVVDHVPEPVKNAGIQIFGVHDKTALIVGTAVLLAIYAYGVGVLALRSWRLALGGIALFAASASFLVMRYRFDVQ